MISCLNKFKITKKYYVMSLRYPKKSKMQTKCIS